ncbi:DNA gyrase C-terminal beta-propeller domain-containing protein [Moorena sp. SIO2C4]|uniref:DNA gyrase C-terminal beta-propeller domain-containing protein n=1 Tax=Moorena sp. SIO2C4 TaxID=2607824 RepID=UPI00257EFD7F|nr:DNA gyrase C-terminal beta-propeller domain-containing protein [Moorena sp. SIO2C4]
MLTTQELMVITGSGKAYPVKIRDIPPAAGRKQGIPLVKLLPNSAQSETVVAHFRVPDDLENFTLVLLTHQGKIKRVSVSELTKLTNRGMLLTKFRNDDQLQYANLSTTATQVVVATSNGRLLRFEVNDKQLPIMGRSAQGNQALRLKGKEKLVGCVVLGEEENLLLVSEQGYGKRLPVQAIRLANRGDLGTQALQFKTAKDGLVSMVRDSIANDVMVVTSLGGKRLAMKSVPIWGKDGTGDRIAQLKPEEKIISVTPVIQDLTV